jgi:DNA polymerase
MLNWDELEKECYECKKCELYKERNNVVIGAGNRNADLMIISEGPGKQEDLTGKLFVGKSGQLLDKILESVNLSREEIYIANIVKCRPPNNRDPIEKEKQACLPYLRNQFSLIQPKIIVCLGRVASQAIIDKSFRITKEHGVWIERKNCSIIGTYHPAALLRDPSKKREVWEDFKKIKKKYDLSLSN